MDHFVDIDLRTDAEFKASQLMSALHAKLHRALVQLRASDIGVSFPGHDSTVPHLGNKLRLHGGLDALTGLMACNWLSGMRDHVNSSGPRPVPVGAKNYVVRRVQAKSNAERLRRRLMRRHGFDALEALRRIPDSVGEMVPLPFLQLRSVSTDQSFRLFIDHRPALAESRMGAFNAYGLSQTATLPWF